MKLKKIFIMTVLLLSIFLIYLTTMDKKIYYLALGDSIALGDKQVSYSRFLVDYFNEKELLEEYRYEFIEDDKRITDLIRDIKDNKTVEVNGKSKTLKNALIKADLITLSIGNEELIYKMKTESENGLYDYIDEMMKDMESLLKIMREYCKEDIFVFSYINLFSNFMNDYIKYANQKLETLSKKYDVEYISLDALQSNKNYFHSLGLSSLGQQKVSEILIPIVEKKMIQD